MKVHKWSFIEEEMTEHWGLELLKAWHSYPEHLAHLWVGKLCHIMVLSPCSYLLLESIFVDFFTLLFAWKISTLQNQQ